MKVGEAIESYLSHQLLRGLEPGSVRTTRHALRTVLAPVLAGELMDLAADGVGEVLTTALGKRGSRTSRKPLTPCTQELYVNAAKAFLGWTVGKGWLQENPLDRQLQAPPPPVPPIAPKHLGTIIKKLRQAAGLTRLQLHTQAKISAATISSCEAGRHTPTAWMLRRLLRVACMVELPEMAAQAGLAMNVGADLPERVGDQGSGVDKP